jgi:hypothetical protein
MKYPFLLLLLLLFNFTITSYFFRLTHILIHVHIRIFPLYAYKVMNLTSESDSNEPGDTIEALISEITVKLIRLGKFLNDSAKVNIFTKKKTIN